ncbi:Eco57I restriction-modification methylase domain-containing protein [Flavobacterium psychrotolerans]|uniref:site-specific DNA-methyltransferase (adenine-specific) n=1 Tax=Flavobacterium psychrotolerans TaxID=2169410 RepID=A0A2U1JPC7_9FLAO|nr:TaqI-like C-terminal specificity domain-containing protein [Flavobacterium psychrotolerans]PWA06834.1 hypothetical protein DB895_02290 [Flavobacterium psychrotolerans]
MSLFQKSVVAKQLQSQDKTQLVAQWNVFKSHFHNPSIQDNIRSSKEEQYQGEFLIDLFVNVLGYTKNPTPNFTITTEYKNVKDSKKADGAILISEKVKAVIELKGTNTTDLNKIEVQAFGYKNNQPDCVYVITSNFEKLRFYIDNATEYIEFNLFHLTEKEFELLYLCLAFENISRDIPRKIKEDSVSQEKDITKKLYSDYSLFKSDLYTNLVALNPEFEPVELFQKSQKLLDRFLFIFFAEDRNLLPTNLIFRINKEWKQLRQMRIEVSLYDRYKIYFHDLNEGAKVVLPAFSETASNQKEEHQIYAYNGGLFKPDSVLDSIKINDEVLFKHTEKLSHYDFQSEVDVNILGHIFENSLNQLDEIKAQLEGGSIDKSSTKRKKDGVFYTPKYITKYIVDNTVGKLCMDKKAEIKIVEEDYFTDKKRTKTTKQPLLEKLTTYRNWLLQITICDPACGSGAFLNQALDFLIAEHQYIDELQAKLFGDALVLSDVEKSILENNLYGVDLNEESVEIAKLSLWLRTAQPNRKLNDLNNNIKCGNSLIDDPAIAGEKAFNWQTAFPQVFKEKQKKAWHITTAIHDSRTSQRMIDYKVREKRAMGTMPKPQIIPLTETEETIIVEQVTKIVIEDNLRVMAFNVCKDHIHLLLVCNEEDVSKIVQKIKAKTAREVNIHRGVTTTREHTPLPIEKERGEKQNSLWTQKFGCKEIVDDNQLYNTIEYIRNNRVKHELPILPILQQWSMLHCLYQSYDDTFREEYKGGFDVIIGNPPYVFGGNSGINELEKKYFKNKYETGNGKVNLFTLFIEKSYVILKQDGEFSFIIPNTFLRVTSYHDSRKFFIKNFQFRELADLGNDVFNGAVTSAIILLASKNIPNFEKPLKIINDFSGNHKMLPLNQIVKNNFMISSTIEDGAQFILNKLQSISILLGDECQEMIFGVVISHNKNELIFDIQNNGYKPFLEGKDISSYLIKDVTKFLKYKPELIHRARTPKVFEVEEKLLVQRITGGKKPLKVAYDNLKYYNKESINNIILKADSEFKIKFILSLLNSSLINWFYNKSFTNDSTLTVNISKEYLSKIPIKKTTLSEQNPFIEKADLMLTLNKELQEQSQKFQRTLQREFLLESLPKKLQDWYLLSYADFIKELEKQKVKLSLSQKAEWEDYFTNEATKLNSIKTQINTTDKAIDTMVYELYGLSEEEIEIVEKN